MVNTFKVIVEKMFSGVAGLSTLFQTNFFRLFLRYCIGV